MNLAERDRLRQRLAVIKAVTAALDRRHEVADLVYHSSDIDTARRRVGDLLGVDATCAEAVVSTQFRRLSERERSILNEEIEDIVRTLSAN